MAHPSPAIADISAVASFEQRRHTADRIFRGALLFNGALTILWLFSVLTQRSTLFFQHYNIDREAVGRVAFGVLQFNIIWGLIWYGIKSLLLKHMVGFSKEERRQAFSSRMKAPFEVSTFVARHSERKIRIADMIGRRGRFITLGMAAFFYLYSRVAVQHSPNF